MKTQHIILISLLFCWVLPTQAEEFAGLILLKRVSSTDRDRDVTSTHRYPIENHILLNCRQDKNSVELKCTENEMSVYRENPRSLAVWELVTADGKLTEKGHAEYKKMLTTGCAETKSLLMKLETAVPYPEYVEHFESLKREIDRLKDMCASEEAAARNWAKENEDEAGTCSITGRLWGPDEIIFKQVGEEKWIRSVGGDDLITLTSAPLLKDGTGGRGWTYVAEGSKDIEGRPWKYVYKGIQIISHRAFEFSSLKDCKKVLAD